MRGAQRISKLEGFGNSHKAKKPQNFHDVERTPNQPNKQEELRDGRRGSPSRRVRLLETSKIPIGHVLLCIPSPSMDRMTSPSRVELVRAPQKLLGSLWRLWGGPRNSRSSVAQGSSRSEPINHLTTFQESSWKPRETL